MMETCIYTILYSSPTRPRLDPNRKTWRRTGAVVTRATALLWISYTYIDPPITDLPPRVTHGGIIRYYGRRFIAEISGLRGRRKHVIRGRCIQRLGT
jgi:hypothetical protein